MPGETEETQDPGRFRRYTPEVRASLAPSSMRRSLTLALDDFGQATLQVEAGRLSVSTAELVGQATVYYLEDRPSGRPALRVPRFAREASAKTIDLELELDPHMWDEVEGEAKRQRVSIERLVEHAALYLMADLDSGRVATRIPTDEHEHAPDREEL
jgi:hypothetical protein